MTEFAIVSTTVAGPDEARRLARTLLESRLSACVQIVPVTSLYRWDGGIETAAEQLMLCKIATADFTAVEAAIRSHHGYEVPEVIMTPIVAGSQSYLDWVAASVAR